MMHLYWVALKSIWAKEIHRFMRIWVQTLVPPVITMTLYFIIFGNLIGSRIGDMHGFSYMQFIVPGLIMMSVITNAYANVASSFFGAKFQRNIEELLVAPVPTHVIIAGYVGGGVALTLLPPFWQGLSHLNPIVYMISGFRYGFLGINDVPLVTTFGVLVVFIVAFYLICWSLIQRGRGLRS
ncbi:MAG: ABC transporter permease [Escherichia coli]|nr:ABC transporter permease [Escherichia coli]